jgi:hypothetical protein
LGKNTILHTLGMDRTRMEQGRVLTQYATNEYKGTSHLKRSHRQLSPTPENLQESIFTASFFPYSQKPTKKRNQHFQHWLIFLRLGQITTHHGV